MYPSTDKTIEELTINTIRTLSMDAVQKANSGHPGTPMALAPLAYVLWKKIMRYNPANPSWFDRDRFVLSNGHASPLQYAVLHLTGYDLSIEDLKKFRMWESKTPGHPEYGITPGVETSTGPLGQGLANAVGMALAEAHLAALFNKPGHEIIEHYTFVCCGDGDFMEGVSHEAASLAGHLGLNKLICFYDDNHITIEGNTDLSYSDDVAKRFASYGWHVINIGDNANNLDMIEKAISESQNEKSKPSLIILRTHIAFGSPHLQDSSKAHGAPLGEEEVKLTKRVYGWPEDEHFYVPDQVREHMGECMARGGQLEQDWKQRLDAYHLAFPELARQLSSAMSGQTPQGWDQNIPVFTAADGLPATRVAGGKVLNAIAERVPFLIGGSADLSPSTNTLIKNTGYVARGHYQNRNIAWGVREFGMCAAASGMALHGGIRPYVSTFFVFSDYARPAIRLASLMRLPVIYIMTHDSIGVGEDGPTHQPVEHLASLRIIPNLCVIRPADANETAFAWRAAMMRTQGPTMLILTRQNLPVLDPSLTSGTLQGAYVLSQEKGRQPDMILIGSGSEVHLLLLAQQELAKENMDARVVSMPSWELFREQPEAYQNQVLPPSVNKRLAVEAGSTFGWDHWVGASGRIIGIDHFGASAPAKDIFKNCGFTIENILDQCRRL
jgi:transketolase